MHETKDGGRAKKSHHKLREGVLKAYGGDDGCACCGGMDNLCVDHIRGSGKEHRKAVMGDNTNGYIFYRWLVKNDFPTGYQVLCRPCNSSKGNGEKCTLRHF